MKIILLITVFNICVLTSYPQDFVYAAYENELSTSDLAGSSAPKPGFDVIIYPTGEPAYTIIRSTLGINGSSKTFTTPGGTYSVSQSIGQSSVIGTSSKKNYTILQGFQQPLISVRTIPSSSILRATVYPNPFSHSINILFDEPITNEIIVMLFDANGRTVMTNKVPAAKLVNLSLNNIPGGSYFLKVTTGQKQFTAKLIKE